MLIKLNEDALGCGEKVCRVMIMLGGIKNEGKCSFGKSKCGKSKWQGIKKPCKESDAIIGEILEHCPGLAMSALSSGWLEVASPWVTLSNTLSYPPIALPVLLGRRCEY